jgi:acyl-CoA thioesterase I
MGAARDFRLSRRAALSVLAGLAVTPPGLSWAKTPVVTILGDSITAGLGLSAADALPAQLQAALLKLGVSVQMRGAGVSGDTTADGLARARFSVQSDTDVCLVALGGNDLLQGVEPRDMKANLLAIVEGLKARRIGVVLAGMAAPPERSRSYAQAFDAVFPDVAKAEHVALYPFLLAGVAMHGELNQHDGVHPNPRGVKIIANGLAPVVARALEHRR